MDTQWAIQKLVEWLELAETYNQTSGESSRQARVELQEREAQTAAIVRARRPNWNQYLAQPMVYPGAVQLAAGVAVVRLVLGELRTETETFEKLGPRGPSIAAANLHPLVWKSAQALWADDHHGQSVQRAATFLNAHVQDRTGRHDISDATLMRQVFSADPPDSGRPRLRWPGDSSDLTVKSMNEGLRSYAPGVFLAIRNVVTHRVGDLTEQEAIEQLAALSLLARWIDGCELRET